MDFTPNFKGKGWTQTSTAKMDLLLVQMKNGNPRFRGQFLTEKKIWIHIVVSFPSSTRINDFGDSFFKNLDFTSSKHNAPNLPFLTSSQYY